MEPITNYQHEAKEGDIREVYEYDAGKASAYGSADAFLVKQIYKNGQWHYYITKLSERYPHLAANTVLLFHHETELIAVMNTGGKAV